MIKSSFGIPLKEEKPEPCECGCGGCEKQERYHEYIKRMYRETEEKDAKL